MASLEQMRKVSELLQNGWRRAMDPANLDKRLMPIGGPTELVGPDDKSYVIAADGSIKTGRLDWDKYCTGGKADWSNHAPLY